MPILRVGSIHGARHERSSRAAAHLAEAEPSGGRLRVWRGGWLVALLLLLATLALQLLSGAYQAEPGTISPDEAAHFVSGLMVRDYLAGAIGTDPLAYAREYYAHYPKVAIGNWPPAFYLAQGIWMLLLPARTASVLLLGAVVAAAIAWTIFRQLRARVGVVCAGFGAALFLVIPPVPAYTATVMAELPLTLVATLAALQWARYLDSGRPRDVVAFVALALLSVLTKTNGLFLALVPPMSIIIGRHWRVLRSRPLWYAAGIGALLVTPWLLVFFDTMREGWSSMQFSPAFTREALLYYPERLVRNLGAAVSIAALVGVWARLGPGAEGERGLWSVAAATPVAVVLFHALVPAGMGGRHLILAYPAVVMLAAAGVRALALPLERRVRPGAAASVALLVALGFAVDSFRLPHRELRGYGAAAEFVRGATAPERPSTSLVASSATGEGAYVAEMAMRDRERPRDTVWRGSKLLASATWAGREYELRTQDASGVLELLDGAGVEWIVLDRGVTLPSSPHLELLERAVAERPDVFRLRRRVPVIRSDGEHPSRELVVYEVLRAEERARAPRLRQVPGREGLSR